MKNITLQNLVIKGYSLRARVRRLAEMDPEKRGDDEGVWRTVRGRRIFIGKGQSFDDALKQSLGGSKGSNAGEDAMKGVGHQDLEKMNIPALKAKRKQLYDNLNSTNTKTPEGTDIKHAVDLIDGELKKRSRIKWEKTHRKGASLRMV